MSKTKKQAVLVATVLMLTFAVSSFAQTRTVCTSSDKGTWGSNITSIAVASNFAEPAKNMLGYYQPNHSRVWVCENSTQALYTEITTYGGRPNNETVYPVYSMFFGADDTADNLPNHFDYARGIPAFFGYTTASQGSGILHTLSDVSSLITGTDVGTGITKDIAAQNISGYGVNTASAEYVAVADPSVAPYGAAAQKILNAMGYHTFPPAFVYSNLFANITLTKNAVGKNSAGQSVKSGFISKAQICHNNTDPTLDNVTYVAFTNPEYTLLQTAALLDDGNDIAVGLYNNIQAAKLIPSGTGSWAKFLIENCYQIP